MRISDWISDVCSSDLHLALHHVGQAVDAHDAVGHAGHGAFVARLGTELDLLDAGLDQFADFGRVERGGCHCLVSLEVRRDVRGTASICISGLGIRDWGFGEQEPRLVESRIPNPESRLYCPSSARSRSSLPFTQPSMTTSPASMKIGRAQV